MTGIPRTSRAGSRFSRGPALVLLVLLLFLTPEPEVLADFRITDLQAELPGSAESLSKLKIALISDLHLSAANSSRHVFTELTNQLNRMEPDLLLLGGDIFHGAPGRKAEDLERIWTQFMARLKKCPALGIYAVLGNHDKRQDEQEIRKILEKSGVRILAPAMGPVPVRTQVAVLYLAGADNKPDEPLSPDFLKQITARYPLILLAHYPEVFDRVPDNARILVLAGHTHGGVIDIPGLKKGAIASTFAPSHRTKYVFGSYGKEGGKKLYVTAGIAGEGNSGLRINNPPEIVVIHLEKPLPCPPPSQNAK
ncbi:MAG: metallophosphoesterase [Lentisphaeria bacterium]|nr:metallophosphoesterase [Lentisphaeria bacterium]